MKTVSLLFFLCFPALGRDPFSRIENINCISSSNVMKEWQLKGIIGSENHYKGWLNSKNNQWKEVELGLSLPFSGWYIDTIFPFQLLLKTTDECEKASFIMKVEEIQKW